MSGSIRQQFQTTRSAHRRAEGLRAQGANSGGPVSLGMAVGGVLSWLFTYTPGSAAAWSGWAYPLLVVVGFVCLIGGFILGMNNRRTRAGRAAVLVSAVGTVEHVGFLLHGLSRGG